VQTLNTMKKFGKMIEQQFRGYVSKPYILNMI